MMTGDTLGLDIPRMDRSIQLEEKQSQRKVGNGITEQRCRGGRYVGGESRLRCVILGKDMIQRIAKWAHRKQALAGHP